MNKLKPNKSNWKRSSIDKEVIIAELKELFSEYKSCTNKRDFITFLDDTFEVSYHCDGYRSIVYYTLSDELILQRSNHLDVELWELVKGDDSEDCTNDINEII